MPTAGQPNLLDVDWSRIPAPPDDGGARHLEGVQMPDVALPATDGGEVSLGRLAGRIVVFAYPRTGQPGQIALVDDWDMIPGARGCTPQSCAFRDLHTDLLAAGAKRVFGLSTQDSAYQREARDRLHLPFPLLSDEKLALTRALKLPTMVEQFGQFAGFVPNAALKAEESAGWDAGLELSIAKGAFVIDATYFKSNLENEIVTRFLPFFQSTAVNLAGESTRKGVEVSARWPCCSTIGRSFRSAVSCGTARLSTVRSIEYSMHGSASTARPIHSRRVAGRTGASGGITMLVIWMRASVSRGYHRRRGEEAQPAGARLPVANGRRVEAACKRRPRTSDRVPRPGAAAPCLRPCRTEAICDPRASRSSRRPRTCRRRHRSGVKRTSCPSASAPCRPPRAH